MDPHPLTPPTAADWHADALVHAAGLSADRAARRLGVRTSEVLEGLATVTAYRRAFDLRPGVAVAVGMQPRPERVIAEQ